MDKGTKEADFKKYEVVIVGAGPAGLRCAEILGNAGKTVLFLEKNKEIGPKVCAGGITRKCFRFLNLPPEIIEGKFTKIIFRTAKNKSTLKFGEDFMYTLSRKNLGKWQLKRLNSDLVTVRTSSLVTRIEKNFVTLNDSEKIGYDYLVGADGSNSIVRRYLGIRTELLGLAFQYVIPKKYPDLEIFFDSKLFNAWYSWIFPYCDSTSVGFGYYPKVIPASVANKNFATWLKKEGIDVSQSKLQVHPINCDYCGHCFGNIFLVGDAAGLVSGFTGEGIYQALLSGEEVAKKIINPKYPCRGIKEILFENRIHHFMLRVVRLSGPLRNVLFSFILFAVKNKTIARLLLRVLT